jgi:hypothetical protein
MNSIPNMVSLPVTIISTVRRIGEPAVKTVLAITKKRVCQREAFPVEFAIGYGGMSVAMPPRR